MILPRYLTAVAAVDADPITSLLVRRRLRLPPGRTLIRRMRDHGLGQADLVLALLRVGTTAARRLVARLVGRPVLVCRSQWIRWPVNGTGRVSRPRLVLVVDNPRRPNTNAHRRFAQTFGVARTLEEAITRGATPRDVRAARRRGWIKESA